MKILWVNMGYSPTKQNRRREAVNQGRLDDLPGSSLAQPHTARAELDTLTAAWMLNVVVLRRSYLLLALSSRCAPSNPYYPHKVRLVVLRSSQGTMGLSLWTLSRRTIASDPTMPSLGPTSCLNSVSKSADCENGPILAPSTCF